MNEQHTRVTVATAYLDTLCCDRVKAAANCAGHEYVDFPTENDLLSSVGNGLPEVLVMPLDDNFLSPIRLQEKLRTAFAPLCVVYLSTSANTSLVVRAMKLGAITVLPRHSSCHQISQSLLDAATLHQIRASWINDCLEADRALNALSERQRDVMSLVIAGETSKEIGSRYDISIKTVEKHRQAIRQRTATSSLADLMRLQLHAERPLKAAFGMVLEESSMEQIESSAVGCNGALQK